MARWNRPCVQGKSGGPKLENGSSCIHFCVLDNEMIFPVILSIRLGEDPFPELMQCRTACCLGLCLRSSSH
jgi:hypothetical protein